MCKFKNALTKIILNNLLLKNHIRCKRKAWLNYHGNKSYQVWSPHNAIQSLTQYRNFQILTNNDLFFGKKGCEIGTDGLIGFKVQNKLGNYSNVEICPPLLKKVDGKSKWGDYKYIPVISKQGKKTTKENLIELSICAIIVEAFQESKIEKGLVISNFNNRFNVENISISRKLRDKTIFLYSQLKESLLGSIPEITQDRKKCAICTWQKYCDSEAKSKGFLTDIDGIGPKTSLLLEGVGISTIKELSNIEEKDLHMKLYNFQNNNLERTSNFINQAKSYLSGDASFKKHNRDFLKINSLIKKGFFIFDIESNPDEKHDFLYGFLSINNLYDKTEIESYEAILNINKQNSDKSIKQLFLKLASHEEWPILHYGETEKVSILHLAINCGMDKLKIDKLKFRFIDLHALIKKSWILPLRNYSLKTVANWTGFEWSQKNANGSRALYWWILYQNTLNKNYLKKIIQYNRDDCFATLEIARWLLKNSH